MTQIDLPNWLPSVGRVLFVVYFVLMGASHLWNFTEHSALLKRKGVPLPKAATLLTVVMMVGGGMAILFGWHRIGAAMLFGIIFPAPFFLHHFWNEKDSYLHLSEYAHFIKDLSLAGAALMLLASA